MPPFKPEHTGLTFTEKHLERARKDRKKEPLASAWIFLESEKRTGLQMAQLSGLRYRLTGDMRFADDAVTVLTSADVLARGNNAYLQTMMDTLVFMQAFETARNHPGFRMDAQQKLLQTLLDRVNALNAPPTTQHFEQLWLGVVNVAAGVVLEREDIFQAGATTYHDTVNTMIHPEGFFHPAVEPGDGNGLYRQILSVEAMVLMAEMASHAGVDLWSVSQRGVSVITAALYAIFYYYYPEKWKWDNDVPQDAGLFRQHGGFLEILNGRTQQKALDLMYKDLRPIYDAAGGGLTTLTHGIPKGFGLFR